MFEPYKETQEIDSSAILFTGLNSYLVDNEDGTYDLYFQNYKVETIYSLEYYEEDIPILTREEFEHAQQISP